MVSDHAEVNIFLEESRLTATYRTRVYVFSLPVLAKPPIRLNNHIPIGDTLENTPISAPKRVESDANVYLRV